MNAVPVCGSSISVIDEPLEGEKGKKALSYHTNKHAAYDMRYECGFFHKQKISTFISRNFIHKYFFAGF